MPPKNKKTKGSKQKDLFPSDDELEKKFDLKHQLSAADNLNYNDDDDDDDDDGGSGVAAAADRRPGASKKSKKDTRSKSQTDRDVRHASTKASKPRRSADPSDDEDCDEEDMVTPFRRANGVSSSGFSALSMDADQKDEDDSEAVSQLESKSQRQESKKAALDKSEGLEITDKTVAAGKNDKKNNESIQDNESEPVDNHHGLQASMEELSLSGLKKKSRKSKKKDSRDSSVQDEAAYGQSGATTAFRDADEATKTKDGTFMSKTDHLTATGILLSHDRSKDIQIDKFSLQAFGQQLVLDTSLNLIYGKKYGLVGSNGCGKSTLLRCLAHREVPIQSSVDLYLLEREYDPTDMTAVEAVVDIVKTERNTLEAEQDELMMSMQGTESARFDFIQERLNELDLSFAQQKARAVLHGLGFTAEMQDMKTKEFSGGWRMRVALARALFVKPTCLFLDDATNHLDLSAVVWLEEYLQSYPHTVVMVSHSQDFINSICSEIMYMNMNNRKLEYFSGNYDTFVKVKAELDESARKKAKADEKKIKKIKENLGRTGAQAKQAKSHQKAFEKMMEKSGSSMDPQDVARCDRPIEIRFLNCGGGLPSPFLKFNDVSFAYPGREVLYRDLNFGIDLNSRVALVGPNGAGKSTLMKLMCGDLDATTGSVYRHHHLRIARFHQHLTEQLNMSMSAVEWLCMSFSGVKPQEMRAIVGRFGLTGKSQVVAMEQLSDGQLRRVVFAWLSQKNCHLLMLDEPTNFLDPETIDALAEGIRQFDGGVVLISHDFRLINQVAEEIWVVEENTVEEWEGDIQDYKDYLKMRITSQ